MGSFDRNWEKVHQEREWGKYPAESTIRFVARNYYSSPKRCKVKILDFGCGGGATTWYLAAEGFDTYAFDGSITAVEKTRQLLEAHNVKAALRTADALDTEYENETFDAVIDCVCATLNTLGNIKKIYSEIFRILKPKGKLFSTSFTADTTGYSTGEKLEENTFRSITEGAIFGHGIVHFTTREEITAMLSEIGFKNIAVDTLRYTDRGNIISQPMVTAERD